MDVKLRDDVQGKKTSSKTQGSGASGKPKRVQRLMQEANCSSKPASKEVVQAHNQLGNRTSRTTKVKGAYILAGPLKSSFDTSSHLSQLTTASQGDIPYSGRPRATRPSSFALAKKRDRNVASIRPHIRSGAKSQISAVDQMSMPQEQTDSEKQESEDNFNGPRGDSKDHHSCKISRHRTQNCRKKFVQPGSFDSSDICYMERLAVGDYNGEELAASRSNMVCKDQKNKVEYSGPLLSLPHKVDELLQRRESHIRRAAQRQKLQRRTEL